MAETRVSHRRGEHVRRLVLAAAFDEIVERGAVGATIAAVAGRSGVHETTIYRRWVTREKLLVDALLNRSADVVPVPDTGSVRSDLLLIVSAIAHHLSTPAGVATVQLCTTLAGDINAEARQAFWAGRAKQLLPVLRRGVERGELRDDIDPLLVLETLVAPLHTRILLTGEDIDDALPTQLVDIVVAGAAPRAAPASTPRNDTVVSPH